MHLVTSKTPTPVSNINIWYFGVGIFEFRIQGHVGIYVLYIYNKVENTMRKILKIIKTKNAATLIYTLKNKSK